MPYKIESGIPIPRQRSRMKRDHSDLAATLAKMQAGESVRVTGSAAEVVRVTAQRVGKASGCCFTTRQVPGGVRVWRMPAPLEGA